MSEVGNRLIVADSRGIEVLRSSLSSSDGAVVVSVRLQLATGYCGCTAENLLGLKDIKDLVNADPWVVVEVGQERQVFLQEGHSQQSLLVLELIVGDGV